MEHALGIRPTRVTLACCSTNVREDAAAAARRRTPREACEGGTRRSAMPTGSRRRSHAACSPRPHRTPSVCRSARALAGRALSRRRSEGRAEYEGNGAERKVADATRDGSAARAQAATEQTGGRAERPVRPRGVLAEGVLRDAFEIGKSVIWYRHAHHEAVRLRCGTSHKRYRSRPSLRGRRRRRHFSIESKSSVPRLGGGSLMAEGLRSALLHLLESQQGCVSGALADHAAALVPEPLGHIIRADATK